MDFHAAEMRLAAAIRRAHCRELLKKQFIGVDDPRCLHGHYGNSEGAGAVYPGAVFAAEAGTGGNDLRTGLVGDGDGKCTRLELFKAKSPVAVRDGDTEDRKSVV